jgi:hypothetical protein
MLSKAIVGKDNLSRKDRKKEARLFNAIQNGEFDFDEYEQQFATPSSMFISRTLVKQPLLNVIVRAT